MRQRFENFMRGRHGMDQLSNFIFVIVMILLILSIFFPHPALYIPGAVLIFISYFRVFSRNDYKRNAENEAFMRLLHGPRVWFNTMKRDAAIRKTHHLYRCPKCAQKIKVPKGKGRIMVTCPKCKTEFQKNS